MIGEKQIPIIKACSALGINRNGFYKQKSRKQANMNIALKNKIQDIALEFPYYGYRRITKELYRRSMLVNHKKVLFIMKENNLLCRRKKKYKPITTQSNHGMRVYPNLIQKIKINNMNQVWISDITYIRLLKEFVYLAVILDLFSRKCIGWSLSRNIDAQLTLNALNKAISEREFLGFNDLIHHSDQGVQYASCDYVKMLKEYGIKISMSRKGNVYDNAFAESFMKTLKIEEVYMNDYETLQDAYSNIKQFIEEVYNKKRLHSSIGYMPPDEFEKEALNIRLT